jgi:hypothetical protein
MIYQRSFSLVKWRKLKAGPSEGNEDDTQQELFLSLQECVSSSRERRSMMKSTKEFWSKKQFTDASSMEQWVAGRARPQQSARTGTYGLGTP